MHYVYKLNPVTDAQLDKPTFQVENDSLPKEVMSMQKYDLDGSDNCGALVVDEDNNTWWCGSMLHTDYVKDKLGETYHNPTVMQVMCAVLGGVTWMLQNNKKGLCFADDVDVDYIMENFKKYLGVVYCGKTGIKYE